jgi:hypothetical protein
MKLIERQKGRNLLCSHELKERWRPSAIVQSDIRKYTSHSACIFKQQLCLGSTWERISTTTQAVERSLTFPFLHMISIYVTLINIQNANTNYTNQ